MEVRDTIIERIRAHAFDELSVSQRVGTNLSHSARVIDRGEVVGPAKQKIKADRASVLVFADDDPMRISRTRAATCSMTPRPGRSTASVAARFPPSSRRDEAARPRPFHEPVQFLKDPGRLPSVDSVLPLHPIGPSAARYAISVRGCRTSGT